MAAALTLAAGLMFVGQSSASAAPPVTDWTELEDAFAAGGTVILANDITQVDTQLPVPVGVPVTLDLNGNDLSISTSISGQSAINVPPGAAFTVIDSFGSGELTVASTNATLGGAGIGGAGFQGSGEITISSGSVEAHGGFGGAGIGGGPGYINGAVTISGGSVTAVGGAGAAGIGGGLMEPGGVSQQSGSIQITGGIIHATGGQLGAGIGGGQATLNGTITISDGEVTALSPYGGAGIGGGYMLGQPNGNITPGGHVTISGGVVTATSAQVGAGIGSGAVGAAGPLTISGGTVTAQGAGGGAGVGGGYLGSGGPVVVSASGVLNVSGVPAIGSVSGGAPIWGSLANSSVINVTSGSISIPSGVTAINSGTINLLGTLTGQGTITNTGRIVGTATTGVIAGDGKGGSGLLVTVHNYRLDFDLNGVAGTALNNLSAYATSVTGAGLKLPTPVQPTGHTFTGWYTSAAGGTQVVGTSDLSTLFGTSGPVNPTLFAHWSITQAINFTSAVPATPTVGDTYSIAATGGGTGNAVAFSTASVACTVAGSTVTFNHAGLCAVDANQVGGGFYVAAPTVSQQITVGKAAQALTFTSTVPAGIDVGDTYIVAADGGLSGEPVVFSSTSAACTIVGSTVTFTGVGDCVIEADQAGNDDYSAALSVSQTASVSASSVSAGLPSTGVNPLPVVLSGLLLLLVGLGVLRLNRNRLTKGG